MVEVIENKFIFRDRLDFVYCYDCKTEMAFNGYSYECPICGYVSTKEVERWMRKRSIGSS